MQFEQAPTLNLRQQLSTPWATGFGGLGGGWWGDGGGGGLGSGTNGGLGGAEGW